MCITARDKFILQAEEELDEEERKQAWLEYEEEKKGKPPLMMVHQNNMLQQQYNMMMNVEQSGMLPPNVTMQQEYQNLQQLICKDVSTVKCTTAFYSIHKMLNNCTMLILFRVPLDGMFL